MAYFLFKIYMFSVAYASRHVWLGMVWFSLSFSVKVTSTLTHRRFKEEFIFKSGHHRRLRALFTWISSYFYPTNSSCKKQVHSMSVHSDGRWVQNRRLFDSSHNIDIHSHTATGRFTQACSTISDTYSIIFWWVYKASTSKFYQTERTLYIYNGLPRLPLRWRLI